MGNVTVVYGMNDTITVSGRVNASYYAEHGVAQNYTGEVLVTISGINGTISKKVNVTNGAFSVNITDRGALGAGTYAIVVNATGDNENYTLNNAKFEHNVTVNKADIEAVEIESIEKIIYGENETLVVKGKFNASTYVVNGNAWFS